MRTRILHRWKTVCLGGLLGISSLCAQADGTGYTPAPENLQARKEFQMASLASFCTGEFIACLGRENGI